MSMPALPKNLARAIDLSALAQPKAVVNSAGLAVTAANMVSDFLAPSNSQVVILLCWSPRSLPSQQIMDILAKFHAADSAIQSGASWRFGTVDVDAEPSVAQAMQVQNVPLAIAVIQEQLVPLFESIPSEEQIRLVIDKVLSLAADRGVGTAPPARDVVEPAMEPEEESALTSLESGDYEAARVAYQSWLKRSPFEPMAKLGLAQTELFIRTLGVDPENIFAKASNAPLEVEVQLLAADMEVMQGQNQSAFDRLIVLVRATAGDERKLAREHLLNLFSLVDPEDPVLHKARQALASALF